MNCNQAVQEFFRAKIRAIVKDAKTAEALCPSYAIGCKRACVADGYYDVFNRENVEVVRLDGASIEQITSGGIKAKGTEYACDDIIFATGL